MVDKKKYRICDKDFSLQFSDHILDNLYGQIGLTALEEMLERLPIFKRLHELSQLGLTKLIFPCAVHTRYVHSIGVMHTAYNMAIHINQNTADIKFEGIGGSFFNDAELQIIRLAGMLHDIGHYPLSHNIEAAYKDGAKHYGYEQDLVIDRQKDLVGCPSPYTYPLKAGELGNEAAKYLEDFSGSQNYHHEAIGNQLITHNKEIFSYVKNFFVLLHDGGEKCLNPICEQAGHTDEYTEAEVDLITMRLLSMIGAMVIGNYEFDSNPPQYAFEKKYSAMIQLIHSDLDADNLDYLLRDATFSGTSYGLMDVNILLNCLTVAELTHDDYSVDLTDEQKPKEKKTHYIVGIMKKGIGCVEQFFHNKYLAYSQMIYNKYVSSLEAMLLYWAKNTLPQVGEFRVSNSKDENKPGREQGGYLLEKLECEETSQAYLHFNDAYIMQEMYKSFSEYKKGATSNIIRVNETMSAILSRLICYTAFDLDQDLDGGECLCVGLGDKEILENMKVAPLYKKYLEFMQSIQDKTIEGIRFTPEEKELMSYRFESYAMTKQVPWDYFVENIAIFADPLKYAEVLKKHYYRLANGVPIIEKKNMENRKAKQHYEIKKSNDCCIKKDCIPDLIVDSDSSALHNMWNQKFVYLRKYKIEPFALPN